MKCWIIEQGNYSDYRVVGIFSTRENAEQALNFFWTEEERNDIYSPPKIVERILNPAIDEINKGLKQFSVRIWNNGKIDVEPNLDLRDYEMHWNTGNYYPIWATDEQSAIKIGMEKHTIWQTTPKVTS